MLSQSNAVCLTQLSGVRSDSSRSSPWRLLPARWSVRQLLPSILNQRYPSYRHITHHNSHLQAPRRLRSQALASIATLQLLILSIRWLPQPPGALTCRSSSLCAWFLHWSCI